MFSSRYLEPLTHLPAIRLYANPTTSTLKSSARSIQKLSLHQSYLASSRSISSRTEMAYKWSPHPLASMGNLATRQDRQGFATTSMDSAGVNVRMGTTAAPRKFGRSLVPEVGPTTAWASEKVNVDGTSDVETMSDSWGNSTPDFFTEPLPVQISSEYLQRAKAGKHYALYTLVPMAQSKLDECLDELNLDAKHEPGNVTFALPPTFDFSTPNKNSMRDVFDYHTSLLDTVKGNPRQLHPDKLLVLVDEDWRDNGIMILNMDSHSNGSGILGLSRVRWAQIVSCLVLVQEDNEGWAALKTEEGYQCFRTQVKGYTNTKWEKLG